jgi:putative membrane protein
MNTEKLDSTPARWYSLFGLVLIPLLIAGGFLIAGLNSTGSYQSVKAAIVNLDDPVTIDGTYIPLGRQLTANLVDSNRTENLTWNLDSEENARAGLATGEYAAMVVIPKNFSAAATSYSGNAGDAQQATIELSTSPVAGVADATLGKAVALAATDSLNQTLTSTYLDKIYIGFNDLGTQFTTMADGASQLSGGTSDLASGIASASDGSAKLSTGTSSYVAGVNELVDSTISALPSQVKLANGVKDASAGASGLSQGLQTYQSSVSSGATDLSAGAAQASQGQASIESALAAYQAGHLPAAALAGYVHSACSTLNPDATDTTELVNLTYECIGTLKGTATGLTAGSGAMASAAAGLDTKDAKTGQSLRSGATSLASGMDTLNTQLQAALPDVATTTANLNKLKAGGNDLVSGVSQLSSGLNDAKTGSAKLAAGMDKFATGIAEGKDKVPSYTTAERENLADVVATPISTGGLTGLANPNLGWVSLLLVLALWLGAFGTFSVLKATSRGLLGSAEPSAKLIGQALLPGVLVVATQALLMAWLAHLGLGLSWVKTGEVTAVLMVAGIAFAVLNQALVSWAGGFGRLVSVLFAVVTAASTLAAAAPGTLTTLRQFSPLSPALDALRAVITDSGGAATATLSVIGWLLIGLLASSIAILRRRSTDLASVVAV